MAESQKIKRTCSISHIRWLICNLQLFKTLYMLSIFSCIMSSAEYFQYHLFPIKIFQEYHPSVKQFRPDLGLNCLQRFKNQQRTPHGGGGGGWGYSHFYFIRRLGHSIYRSPPTLIFTSYVGSGTASTVHPPPQISGISSTPKEYLKFYQPK